MLHDRTTEILMHVGNKQLHLSYAYSRTHTHTHMIYMWGLAMLVFIMFANLCVWTQFQTCAHVSGNRFWMINHWNINHRKPIKTDQPKHQSSKNGCISNRGLQTIVSLLLKMIHIGWFTGFPILRNSQIINLSGFNMINSWKSGTIWRQSGGNLVASWPTGGDVPRHMLAGQPSMPGFQPALRWILGAMAVINRRPHWTRATRRATKQGSKILLAVR